MKQVKCKDLGLDCEFVATGETPEAAHTAMTDHGGQVHANLMDGKTPEEQQQMTKAMDEKITASMTDA